MIKKFLTIITVLTLSACAFNNDNPNNNSEEILERQRQLEKFNRIVGLYTGKLYTSTSAQDVEIRLFTLDENAGSNSNGADRLRKVLRASFAKTNPVSFETSLKGVYYPETGELTFVNIAEPGKITIDDIHTINANINNQKITGEVKSISNVIGRLEVTLSSNQSSGGGDNQTIEYYKRLRQEYETITGTYAGENIVDGKPQYNFTLELRLKPDGIVPKLIGFFRRENLASVTMNFTNVVYQPNLNPPQLTIHATPRDFGKSATFATFEGILINDEYTGSWSTETNGFQGSFKLKKIPQGTTP